MKFWNIAVPATFRRVDHAGPAADGRRERCADDPHLRERADAEDQARPQDDVDGVGEPEHPHRDGGVAGASEYRVDQEQHQHGAAAGEHDAGEVRADRQHFIRRPHHREQVGAERDADDEEHDRDEQPERDRLHGRPRRGLRVLLADASRHDRRRADGQPHRHGVDHHHQRLGDADGRDRRWAQVADEVDVGHQEHRLHQHLEHHRHGEQNHCPADRHLRVVLVRPTHRLAQRGPHALRLLFCDACFHSML
jgi:hypothetical protein